MGRFVQSVGEFCKGIVWVLGSGLMFVFNPDPFGPLRPYLPQTFVDHLPTLTDERRRLVFLALTIGLLFWWFHKRRTEWEDAQPADPNMPLHIACRWIARDSTWAANFRPKYDNDWPALVHDEIMSKLRLGRVEFFGRRRETSHSMGPFEIVRPADKDRIEWDASKLSLSEPPTHCYIPGGVCYYNVMLDERQVRSIWSKRSIWDRLRRRSPIERIGGRRYDELFKKQDTYYNENGGFSPIPLRALFDG